MQNRLRLASPRAELPVSVGSTRGTSISTLCSAEGTHPKCSWHKGGRGAGTSTSPRPGASVCLLWALICLQLPRNWHLIKS